MCEIHTHKKKKITKKTLKRKNNKKGYCAIRNVNFVTFI